MLIEHISDCSTFCEHGLTKVRLIKSRVGIRAEDLGLGSGEHTCDEFLLDEILQRTFLFHLFKWPKVYVSHE